MDSRNQFQFKHNVKTQEESALSFIAGLGTCNKEEIAKQLGSSSGVGSRYRMQPPNGTQEDFAVQTGNSHTDYANIQTAGPALYQRHYGFWVGPSSGSGQGIYLSFVAGPNAKHPGAKWPSPRPAQRGKLDTTYRTASRAAMESYDIFRQMVQYAVWASLVAMREQGLQRAIIAPLSCGIYGGDHQERLRSEYEHLCIDVLEEVEATHGAFKEVLVPVF